MKTAFRFLLRLMVAIFMTTAIATSYFSTVHAAATWYVSPAGNDSNSCLSSSDACLTIQAAIEKAAIDDTIMVAAGTYHENLILHRNATIIGDDMYSTIVDAGGVNKGLWIDTSLTVTLQDIAFTNSGSGYSDEVANAGIIADNLTNLTMIRCRTGNNLGYGIVSAGTLLVDHSVFDHNANDALYLAQSSDATIRNATIANNDKNGINLRATAVGATVLNSILANNGTYGISVATGAPTAAVSYSDFWQNTSGDSTGSVSMGSGNLALDPLFQNPANGSYYLPSNSPMIDAGNPAAQYNDPDGSRNDMGAFYYNGPPKPSALMATPFSPTQINLSWTDNSSDESNFRIERSPNGSSWTEVGQVSANTTSYSSGGLTCNTAYSYRVRAYRSADGQYSAYSNVATATTQSCLPPPPPTFLSAVPSSQTQINLSWTDNSSDESDFRIERSNTGTSGWSEAGNVPTNTTIFSSTGLSCGSTYYFRVRAHRAGDNSFSTYSDTANATTFDCAPAMSVRSEGGITINTGDVTPNTGDGTNFGIVHVDNISATNTFEIWNTGTAALTLSGSPMVAISGAGAADFEVTAQPAGTVGVNQSVSFEVTFDPSQTGIRSATVSIANNDSSKNPYTFAIQGEGTDMNYTVTVSPSGDGAGNVISIPAGINCGPTCAADFGLGSTVELQASPELGSVFAGWSGAGCSGTGACMLTMTGDQTVTAEFNTGSNLIPEKVMLTSPENRSYTNNPALNFTWQAAAEAAKYRLQISRDSSFNNIVKNEVLNGTSFAINTLPDRRYFWRVAGMNAYNKKGPWSDVYSVVIDQVAPKVPWQMIPVNNMPVSTQTPTLLWKKVSGVSAYFLEIATEPAFVNLVYTETTSKSNAELSDANALAFGMYYWRVRAVDATGNDSGWSPAAQFSVTLLKGPRNESFTHDKTPTLRWVSGRDFDWVNVQLATDAAFSNVIADKDVPASRTTFTTQPLEYQQYFWRIRVMQNEQWSDWMAANAFTVTPGLGSPVTLTPRNRSVDTTGSPVFTWREISDHGLGQPNTYQIQIDTVPSFSNPQTDTVVTGTTFSAGTLAPGRYFWRVRAINSLGYTGSWCYTRRFVIK